MPAARLLSMRILLTYAATIGLMASATFGRAPQVDSNSPDALARWNFNSPATQPSTQSTNPLQAQSRYVAVEKPYLLIVSVDGLRPDCMLRADASTLRSLMDRGSFTLWARTTDIAITTPSHVSMLTGVTPERHGILFNADPPEGVLIGVPTIFDEATEAGLSTGMASGKSKFVLFTRTHCINYSAVSIGETCDDAAVGTWAQEIVRDHQPRVMFVHFAGADVAGHGKGWGTPAQIEVIGKIDRALAVVLKAYDDAGLRDSTYIIVSADHGGSMRTHGQGDLRSHFIPWIFVGPGIRDDYDLTRLGKDYDIATFDTFATGCYVMGLPVPSDSDGKPILPAFKDYDLLQPDKAPAVTTTSPAYLASVGVKSTTQPTTRP